MNSAVLDSGGLRELSFAEERGTKTTEVRRGGMAAGAPGAGRRPLAPRWLRRRSLK